MSPFRRLLSYAIRYRQAFLVGLGCVLVTQGVALAAPIVLRYAIDDLTRSITVGGAISVTAGAAISITAGAAISITAGAAISITAPAILLNGRPVLPIPAPI